MVATTARWTATGLVAVAVTSIAVIHACPRGDRAQRPEQSPTGMADPPRSTTASPSPARPASPAPAPPGEQPAIPTVSLPCVDDRTELRIGHGERRTVPVLCWGDRCIGSDRGAVPTPPAPVTAASPPAAVVGPEQVCTGARCDPLGPRLRAVLAKSDPDDPRSATRDHAAIVVWRDRAVEVWNRASDRQIGLNTSPIIDGDAKPDTTPESIDILGDFLLVSWDCHEWCSSVATLLDGRGRDTGTGVVEIRRARAHGVSRLGASIFAAGDDRFLVFGQFGQISMIAHGRVIARSSLVSPSAGAIEFDARAVPDGEGNMDALWCRDTTCYVTRISVLQQLGYDVSIELEEHFVLPRCPGPDDHTWPPRPNNP
jgi:hypothetical protein